MAKKQNNGKSIESLTAAGESFGWAEDGELLACVEGLLSDGQADKAIEVIGRSGPRSPWVSNALAVCQLRLGRHQVALDICRELVVAGASLRPDAPPAFKVNFATALMLSGNTHGGLGALREVRDAAHPAVKRLQDAVRQWRSRLTVWQKANWFMGGEPPVPLALDFPPGELR